MINDLFTQFTEYAKSNPVIGGLAGLWGLAVVTFIFKSVPLSIFNFIKQQFTTTLHLNSQDDVFFDLLRWIGENQMHSFVRNINFNNGKNHESPGSEARKTMTTIGYGTTFFKLNGRLFLINRSEVPGAISRMAREKISITTLGRSSAPLHKLFETIALYALGGSINTYKVYTYSHEFWSRQASQRKRPLGTIAMKSEVKNLAIAHIEDFIADKEWRIENGIPYRTALMLYGPPGTGKTSLITGICSHFNKDLYIINLANISDQSLMEAFSSVPDNGIIVIEDIDAFGVKLKRASSGSADSSEEEGLTLKDSASTGAQDSLTISGLLNAIDGVVGTDGRIIIATTNHINKLDPALIRSGRFDLKVEVSYMCMEVFSEYMKKFYPNFTIPEDFKLSESIAPSTVQEYIMRHRKDPNAVLDLVGKR